MVSYLIKVKKLDIPSGRTFRHSDNALPFNLVIDHDSLWRPHYAGIRKNMTEIQVERPRVNQMKILQDYEIDPNSLLQLSLNRSGTSFSITYYDSVMKRERDFTLSGKDLESYIEPGDTHPMYVADTCEICVWRGVTAYDIIVAELSKTQKVLENGIYAVTKEMAENINVVLKSCKLKSIPMWAFENDDDIVAFYCWA